jgi:ubiquinone/menaquinone biosynthesis C-methylase UbiE
VDVSEAMVNHARESADRSAVANAHFVVNAEPSLPFDDGAFDFAITWIVLQHLPPSLTRTYITELLRVVKPGGILVFQLPGELLVSSHSRSAWKRRLMTALPNEWVQQIHRFRAGKTDTRELPMHGVRRHKVIQYVEERGGQVVAVIEDNAAGSAWRSFHYFVQRSPQTPL